MRLLVDLRPAVYYALALARAFVWHLPDNLINTLANVFLLNAVTAQIDRQEEAEEAKRRQRKHRGGRGNKDPQEAKETKRRKRKQRSSGGRGNKEEAEETKILQRSCT